MRKRQVPMAATADEVILKSFRVQISTTRHLPAKSPSDWRGGSTNMSTSRQRLVGDAAVQICLQAGDINRRQQLQGSETA